MSQSTSSKQARQGRAQRFHELHHAEDMLILPNAWDVASAKIIEQAGFNAVATTSAGVAWSLGYADGERIPRDEMLRAVERIARAVEVPVSADLEAGYGEDRKSTRLNSSHVKISYAVF